MTIEQFRNLNEGDWFHSKAWYREYQIKRKEGNKLFVDVYDLNGILLSNGMGYIGAGDAEFFYEGHHHSRKVLSKEPEKETIESCFRTFPYDLGERDWNILTTEAWDKFINRNEKFTEAQMKSIQDFVESLKEI